LITKITSGAAQPRAKVAIKNEYLHM